MDGHFMGTVGIGMSPQTTALSITGDTYMNGSLGINVPPSSYTVDVLGNVNTRGYDLLPFKSFLWSKLLGYTA